MNTLNLINELINADKQIKSMRDSVYFINDRLNTFYNTDKEKEDILRNINHIKLLLSKQYILSKLSESDINLFKDAIHRGEAVL